VDPFSKLKGMSKLLVDDDELIRDSLILAFKSKCFFLLISETPEEMLDALEKKRVVIIVGDFKLSGIDAGSS